MINKIRIWHTIKYMPHKVQISNSFHFKNILICIICVIHIHLTFASDINCYDFTVNGNIWENWWEETCVGYTSNNDWCNTNTGSISSPAYPSSSVCCACGSGTNIATESNLVDCDVGKCCSSCVDCNQHTDNELELAGSVEGCKCVSGVGYISNPDATANEMSLRDYALGKCINKMCNVGSYLSGGICEICPFGTTSLVGSTNILDCVCDVQFSLNDDEKCVACENGKFKAVVGTTSCEVCTSEFDSGFCGICNNGERDENGNCQCKIGYTGSDGNCKLCSYGSYKTEVGSSLCVECEAGKFTISEGTSTSLGCLHCPDGSQLSNHIQTGLTIANCLCDAGKTGSIATECMNCDIGKYKNILGSSLCLDCVYSTSVSGSTSIYDCQCNPGFTVNADALCTACEPGKMKNTFGNNACTLCPDNKYSTSQSCVTCPSGSSVDRITNKFLQNNIEDCSCNIGMAGENGATCLACAVGTYKKITGNSMCQCDDISTLFSFSHYCQCNRGYTRELNGACTACAEGKYKNSIGNNTCDVCDKGQLSMIGSTSIRSCVCAWGTYATAGKNCQIIDKAESQCMVLFALTFPMHIHTFTEIVKQTLILQISRIALEPYKHLFIDKISGTETVTLYFRLNSVRRTPEKSYQAATNNVIQLHNEFSKQFDLLGTRDYKLTQNPEVVLRDEMDKKININNTNTVSAACILQKHTIIFIFTFWNVFISFRNVFETHANPQFFCHS